LSRPTVAVSQRLFEPALERLDAVATVRFPNVPPPVPAAELHAAVHGCDAAVTLLSDRVDDAFLEAAGPRLRLVANVAVGYDNIDLAACARHSVIATNTPGVLTDATADIAIALMLMVTRRLGEGERLIRAGVPWKWGLDVHLGTGLRDKTLGIVGLGQIGRATARRARGFGMRIAYSGRRRADPEVVAELDAEFLPLDDLLAGADVVSIHCPLTPESTHLIGEAQLASMNPTAFLVNTARGPIVDEDALVRALQHGVIAGAGLDVFEHEPVVHPGLLELENVVLVPHLGSATLETRTAMAVLAAENVAAVLTGSPPLTEIPNPYAP
jgi:glyoxylate reductase